MNDSILVTQECACELKPLRYKIGLEYFSKMQEPPKFELLKKKKKIKK